MIIDLTPIRNEFSGKTPDKYESKRKEALAYLGDKWVLHKKHAPKNKNRATAAANQFMVS